MNHKKFSWIGKALREQRWHRKWNKLVGLLGILVVFCTVYSLIMPAVTMETSGLEQEGHIHTDECYQIIKTDEKTELDCPLKLHTHTDGCYDGERNLICGYADFAAHTHDSYCYDTDGKLVCILPEIKEHTHTKDCYLSEGGDDGDLSHIHTEDCYTVQRGSLICGQEEREDDFSDGTVYTEASGHMCGLEESESHTHDESCYEAVPESDSFLDEPGEHRHTDDCYEQIKVLTCGFEGIEPGETDAVFPDAVQETICGKEEIVLHIHDDTCYDLEGKLICGQLEVTEHQHTQECIRIVQEASEEKVLVCTEASGSEGDDSEKGPEDGSEEEGEQEEPPDTEEHKYSYENDTVTVEVTFEEENRIPEDAELTVRPVTEAAEDYDYELLKAQADEALEGKPTRIDFYDISFYTAEKVYIPVTNPASVTLRFKSEFMTDADKIAVLHYQTREDAPVVLDNVEKEVEQETDNGVITALTFQTDGFSVFAVAALSEKEPAEQEEKDSFNLIYNNGGQDYTITFKIVDSDGNPILGNYKDIPAKDATRYIFGKKDSSTDENDKVFENFAPAIEGYIYSGATGVTGTKNNGSTASWNKPLYSVATNGYADSLKQTVSGFKFYTMEPVTATQILSWGYGTYTVTLSYTKLDNKTFAIVNRTGGNYAMTSSGTSVNNVDGLASQPVTVIQDGASYQAIGDVTRWTFHKQEDGTYTISTIVTESDGQEVTKYLRLYEKPYDNSNDGRGSLTLTDEANASHITVKGTGDGSVALIWDKSCINMDASAKEHSFWCFNDSESNNSKHFLCEIVTSTEDYSGSWVIVNMRKNATTGIAIQANGVDDSEISNREGLSVTVRKDTAESAYTVLHDDASVWKFDRQENGTYYISTTITDTDGAIKTKYLTIGNSNNAAVTLGDNPQPIHAVQGAGDYAGMVRLINSGGFAVSLINNNAGQGFGSSKDSGQKEWQTLCIPGKSYGIVENVANHPSSVINLFDYWVTERDDADTVKDTDELNLKERGINEGHLLKFSYWQGKGGYNGWTGSSEVFPDIVQRTLGEDGYPVLNVDNGESLAYLFDPDRANDYRESYRNVTGLLQVDRLGYYYYNSAENFAEYQKDTNRFTLYDTWGVYPGGSSPKGQFFPFNSMEEVMNVTSVNPKINHYLGLTLTTRFVQRYGGHATSSRSTDTVFNFAGDDDVWIFIDNVLVADLGGIHDRANVSINFANGNVLINGRQSATLKDLFQKAGSTIKDEDWNGDTFADNTYHTLKFFYLERGNTDSNLYLQYNLTEIPLTGIYKVNQYGSPVARAEFSVYKADENYKILENSGPAYTGVTDAKGEMFFKDDDGMPYSLNDLKTKFGTHFVLKETEAPEHYSLVSDEIHLYIENDLLLCANTYESGVWSSPTLQVAAPHTLKCVNGEEVPYYDFNTGTDTYGTLFAVVLKYTGEGADGLTKQNNWSPVYGSSSNGYTVVDVSENCTREEFINKVVLAAKEAAKYGNVCFAPSASGTMQLEMSNLPGNVSTYYHMLDENHKGNTQYTVAYYWTDGSLVDANSNNTYRVNAEDQTYMFDRVFGATIEVPNIINRLFAQKLNEGGELVNGATFALYEVEEEGGEIYYKYKAKAGEILIHLEPDTDGDGRGKADIKGDTSNTFVYQIESDGKIIVKTDSNEDNTQKYTIEPYKTAETLPASAGSEENPSKEEGTATFSEISDGKYYMREISVPTGYQLNSTEVMVLVAHDAVYANAGTEDDGVTVARGPGYLVATMNKFASKGDIDNTLTWVYERMRISGESNTFSAYDNDNWKTWDYLKENNSGITVGSGEESFTIYLEYDPGSDNSLFNYTVNPGRDSGVDAGAIRRRLYTTVGWSYYELYQDYEYGEGARGNANYTRLVDDDGKPREIANLFSRSTYIQVTDKKMDGTLEISKTVKNAPQGNSGSDTYTFTVELKDGNNGLLTGSYAYKVYNITTFTENGTSIEKTKREPATDDKGKEIVGTITKGKGEITLKDKQVAVIENLPAGTNYTVTEDTTNNTGYIISAVRDEGKIAVGTGTGEKEFAQNVVIGTLYWAVTRGEDGTEQTDTTSTVEYTNTYPSDLTIHKVDSSNTNLSLSGAEFVFYKQEGTDDKKKLYYSYTEPTDSNAGSTGTTSWIALNEGESQDIPDSYKLTTDRNGIISLHGIENGTYYLEELNAPKGYYPLTEAITITVEEGKLTGNYDTAGITISGNGLILTVPNNVGYELPATGGYGTIMYTLCGLVLMTGSLMYIFLQRKKGVM